MNRPPSPVRPCIRNADSNLQPLLASGMVFCPWAVSEDHEKVMRRLGVHQVVFSEQHVAGNWPTG